MENEKKRAHGVWVFLRSKGRIWILLGGVLAGVALLLVGGGAFGKPSEATTSAQGESLDRLTAYEQELEAQLAQLCSAVSGASQVDVMVRLSSGSSIIYAADGNGKPSTVGSGSSEAPLYSSLQAPSVAGVGIVCRGGNDPVVQQKLIDLVSTTLDISASRVFVAGK